MAERRGQYGSLQRAAAARCPAEGRDKGHGQTRCLPGSRRSAWQSAAVHSEHPDREGPRRRHADCDPAQRRAASCKWLAEIKVLDKEFEGNFMNPGYRMPNQPVKPGEAVKPEDTHPVTALNVKSVISSPQEGATLKSRVIAVQGVAWAGEADVVTVEVSVDGGSTWAAAELGKDKARYAWRLFHHQVKLPRSGEFVLMSRATDSQGHVQPA